MASAPQSAEASQPILIVVMGVAGTGKSTLAQALDKRLGMPYIEGDDLHPKANIDKMAHGTPLTDADREPWLALIRTTAEHMVAEQQAALLRASDDKEKGAGMTGRRCGVMVTCSALKRYYRDILRGARPVPPAHLPAAAAHLAPAPPTRLPTYFVYIKGDERLLRARMARRTGHFMKPEMLDSQLATLESPEGEEGVVVVPLERTTEEQVEIALRELERLVGPLRAPGEGGSGEPEVVKVPEELRVPEPEPEASH